jgi:putative PIN family toxin of toxin-antitoxin system
VIRAVLDANVVVSALIRPEGPSGRVVDRIVRGAGAHAVASPAILDECRRSLAYPRVRRRLRLSPAEVDAWMDAFTLIADVVPGERSASVVAADPDDDKYFAAAIEGRASFVVSGDRHVLDVGVYEGVRAVTPRDFLALLDRTAGN